VAYAKVYQEARDKIKGIDKVVLPHLWDESLFVTRVSPDVTVLGGYNWVLAHRPPVWEIHDDFLQHATNAHSNFSVGFETLARRGMSVEAFRQSLVSQVQTGECWPTGMYFFSLWDCWQKVSSNTSPGLSRLPSAIDPLTEMYANYLAGGAATASNGTVLLITKEPLPADGEKTVFRNTLVAALDTIVRGIRVHAYGYLQSR
jgi:hypothetical protein